MQYCLGLLEELELIARVAAHEIYKAEDNFMPQNNAEAFRCVQRALLLLVKRFFGKCFSNGDKANMIPYRH